MVADEVGIRIDAQEEWRSHTRYINHSHDPNCALVWITTPARFGGYIAVPYVMVISTIEPGTELTFDYGPLFGYKKCPRLHRRDTRTPRLHGGTVGVGVARHDGRGAAATSHAGQASQVPSRPEGQLRAVQPHTQGFYR